MSDLAAFLRKAGNVRPSGRQLKWYETNFYAFIHYGMNTYTGREWGDGTESPALFSPTELDCSQWVKAIKDAGMRALILTAKHHDGFCLWPTMTTEHCVRNSPYRGDVVREAVNACRRWGLPFGFYLSPWDRNSALYGTEEYNDYYKSQLTELLTQYGEIFCVWFDGACGEGPNGKRQRYDYEGYFALVRKYQPRAVIFSDGGPDVRWIGNEAGATRHAEWAVVPCEIGKHTKPQTGPGPLTGSLSDMDNSREDIGALSNILYSKGLCFMGAEADMSIRRGWFYHEDEAPHTLDRLFDTYVRTVGGNACLNLNIPPMPSGKLDPRDIARLAELGEKLRATFASDVAQFADITRIPADEGDTQCVFDVLLPSDARVSYVVLAEDIAFGQRVETFAVQYETQGGWRTAYQGTTIGHKRICPVDFQARHVRVAITSARDCVEMLVISLY